jgi:excisionase family DNA binding protein
MHSTPRDLTGTQASPDSTATSDALLTADEVAALLQVTCAWVYAETRRDRIPHLRLGRYVRYRREALDIWMNQVEMRSSSPATPARMRSEAVNSPTRRRSAQPDARV